MSSDNVHLIDDKGNIYLNKSASLFTFTVTERLMKVFGETPDGTDRDILENEYSEYGTMEFCGMYDPMIEKLLDIILGEDSE